MRLSAPVLAIALLASTAAHASIQWDFVMTDISSDDQDASLPMITGQMILSDEAAGQDEINWDWVESFNLGFEDASYHLGASLGELDQSFTPAFLGLAGYLFIDAEDVTIDLQSDARGYWYGGIQGQNSDACDWRYPCYFEGYWVDPVPDQTPPNDSPPPRNNRVPEPGTLALMFGAIGLAWSRKAWGMRA